MLKTTSKKMTARKKTLSQNYSFNKVQKKWSEYWIKNKIYHPNLVKAKEPFYNLMMFPILLLKDCMLEICTLLQEAIYMDVIKE